AGKGGGKGAGHGAKPAGQRGVRHSGFCVINVDGASRGNPGEAGAGAVIKDPEGRVLKRLKKYLGTTTNNMAEYQALVMALEAARSLKLERIRVLADSELMVKQINRVYRVKSPGLKPLYDRARALLAGFSKDSRVSHVYREQNGEADSLANEAIDGSR
ncbi:MAG: ribonuclease HI family protein, partial [Thermodesulfobacteriota bacterium]